MSNIDASNVVVTTEGTDPVTGEYVVEVDGVEISRTPQPEVKNDIDITIWLRDTYIPLVRLMKDEANTAKAAAQTVKDLPITSIAEARVAVRDLCDVVIDLARMVNDLAAGEVKSSRKLLLEFDGTE